MLHRPTGRRGGGGGGDGGLSRQQAWSSSEQQLVTTPAGQIPIRRQPSSANPSAHHLLASSPTNVADRETNRQAGRQAGRQADPTEQLPWIQLTVLHSGKLQEAQIDAGV